MGLIGSGIASYVMCIEFFRDEIPVLIQAYVHRKLFDQISARSNSYYCPKAILYSVFCIYFGYQLVRFSASSAA